MGSVAPVPVPSFGTAPLPTDYARPFATPEGEGAGFGDVLQGAARVASEYVETARQNANTTAQHGALAQGEQAFNTDIMDDRTGYLSLRGEAAMAGRDKALQSFNKKLDDINGGLTEDQQRMFAPQLQALRQRGAARVIEHESGEIESYSQAKYRGAVDETIKTLEQPSTIADPAATQAQIGSIYQIGIDEAKRRYGNDASRDVISSVVTPELQKAAHAGMEAAIAESSRTGDPSAAKNAFEKMGKYLSGDHQRYYAGQVDALDKRAAVNKQSQSIIGGAATSVPMPGDAPVARIDATKLAAKLADLPPDSPYAADIEKAVGARQQRLDRVWTGAVGTVFDRAESAALKGGGFDLDRASPVDIEWLRVNAPAQLLRLQQDDQRGTRVQSTRESHDAYSALALDMDARKDVYQALSVPEFGQIAADRGLGAMDRDKARKLFDAIQKGGLSETINSTVSKELGVAFPHNKEIRERLQGDLLDAAKDYAARWSNGTQGQVIPTTELRKFVRSELVTGKVQDTGLLFDARLTRLEYQRVAQYQGKAFEPLDATAEPVPEIPTRGPPVSAATPGAPAPSAGRVRVVNAAGQLSTIPAAQVDAFLRSEQGKGYRRAGGPVAGAAPAPSPQDAAALDWLSKNPNGAGAEKVRAKLRAKGLVRG